MEAASEEPLVIMPSLSADSTALVPRPTHVMERHARNALFRKPPPKRRPATRNAAPRRRNAGPAPQKRANNDPPASSAERIGQSFYAIGTSGVASMGGALAARWGVHPYAVAGSLAGVGFVTAWRGKSETTRQIGTGMASAGLSQALLMLMQPAPAKASPAPASAPPPAPPPRTKNADLGTLPPGWLDAAFEQARAEMAAEAQHAAPYHHTIPFVP